MAYGPLRPTGLINSQTEKRPYAVVQLRQDNRIATLYNIVGFQTNLKFREQKRIFQMIPGLENAEFFRYGQMHRNTFINSPKLIRRTLQLKYNPNTLFAGQIIGTEGYCANIASGLVAGINASHLVLGRRLIEFPETTMIGALLSYVTDENISNFQPMKPNIGLLPVLSVEVKGKQKRRRIYAERAIKDLEEFINRYHILN